MWANNGSGVRVASGWTSGSIGSSGVANVQVRAMCVRDVRDVRVQSKFSSRGLRGVCKYTCREPLENWLLWPGTLTHPAALTSDISDTYSGSAEVRG